MSKWHLIFDVDRCNSCNNCVLATKDEYLGNRFEGYSEPAPKLGDLWFTLRRQERGKAPMIDVSHFVSTCHQCAEPACINERTRDVISQREDGIVMIDPVKAKGRRDLVDACPLGQIHWNEELEIAQKYSLDAHLLDSGWKEPRAVQSCPTQAITIVRREDRDMAEVASAQGMVTANPELGMGQRIWFRHFDRVTKSFLGGTLMRVRQGREDCAEGLTVVLTADDGTVSETTSDPFGDFKFDGLRGEGEAYRIAVRLDDGSLIGDILVELRDSLWVGLIQVP